MITRMIVFALSCALAFASPGSFKGEKPRPVFSLAIASPETPIKAGAELKLHVTITNTSERDITFVTSVGPVPDDDHYYRVTPRYEDGSIAPPSRFVRERDERIPIDYGSQIGRTLRPKQSFVDQITVTWLFDLSRPGRYTISVARQMPPRQNLGNSWITSNEITITVVP